MPVSILSMVLSGLLRKAWRARQRKYICETCEYKVLAA